MVFIMHPPPGGFIQPHCSQSNFMEQNNNDRRKL